MCGFFLQTIYLFYLLKNRFIDFFPIFKGHCKQNKKKQTRKKMAYKEQQQIHKFLQINILLLSWRYEIICSRIVPFIKQMTFYQVVDWGKESRQGREEACSNWVGEGRSKRRQGKGSGTATAITESKFPS